MPSAGFQYEFSSFSGHDMVASFTVPGSSDDPKVFGELLTLSYSTHRQMVPVRPIGHINPKGYVRGPRTIAGTLVFQALERHIVWEFQDELRKIYEELLRQGRLYEASKIPSFFLMDELPPFNITVTALNEFGRGGRFSLMGCMIMEEGQVVSIADLAPYQTYTFVALGITPMESATRVSRQSRTTNGPLGIDQSR